MLNENQIKVLRWITRDLPEETIEAIRLSDALALQYIANSAPSMIAQRERAVAADEANKAILEARIAKAKSEIEILNSVLGE